MRATTITFILLTGGILFVLFYVFNTLTMEDTYNKRLKKSRKEREKYFKESKDSPVKNQEQFNGLAFFAPNKKFRIEAGYKTLDNPKPVTLSTGKNKKESYLKYARAIFSISGKKDTLILLKNMDQEKPRLFIPFKDQTNGQTTYSGGRYLNIPLPPSGAENVTIDFNKAFHPFCVYNSDYVCPKPPDQNFLPFPVKAGEKLNKKNTSK